MKAYYANDKDSMQTAKFVDMPPESITAYYRRFRSKYPSYYAELEDNFILSKSNVRYKKETQKHQDRNRIANKSFREDARIENAVEEYGKEIVVILKEHNDVLKNITVNDNNITAIRIDLQNVEGIKGYDIIDELKASESKSIDKTRQKTTILTIVV